jgi:excisionase family DNA binding protein
VRRGTVGVSTSRLVCEDRRPRSEEVDVPNPPVDAGDQPEHSKPPREPLVKVGELAKTLDVSPSLVYRLVRDGTLPHYRIGGNIRIDRNEALEAIRRAATR